VYSTQTIKVGVATLTVGFLLAIAFAATAVAGNGVPHGMTAQEWRAQQARDEAMNRYYHLGAYSPRAVALRAEQRRSQAMDQYYHLGRYAVIRVPSQFDWADAGIGAGAMLGAILLAGGLTVAVRRRQVGKPSLQSTA
jgi:hypothetical protein